MKFPRSLISLSLLASTACSAQENAPQIPISERAANLPGDAIDSWFRAMLSLQFNDRADALEFYGDVGPTNGCAEIGSINRRITARDFPEFRKAFLEMLTKTFPSDFLSKVPDSHLAIYLGSRFNRMFDKLHPFLEPRAAEMLKEAKRWATSQGYERKRLGYNKAGIPYWANQPALITLVCADLKNSGGLLQGWRQN